LRASSHHQDGREGKETKMDFIYEALPNTSKQPLAAQLGKFEFAFSFRRKKITDENSYPKIAFIVIHIQDIS
jgi:hypothetical protein